jgi:TetR/AcrR family transcriptional regulator
MSKTDREGTTEAQILLAARDVFTHKGYADTRMQDIADKAGLNHALLHYYFRSKEKLFNQIFEEELMLFLMSFAQLWVKEASLFEKIDHIIDTEMRRFVESPHIPFFLMHELSQRGDRLRERLRDAQFRSLPKSMINAQIEEEVKTGIIRPISAEHLLMLVLSAVIFPFMARPLVLGLMNIPEAGFAGFIEQYMEQARLVIKQGLAPNPISTQS